MSDNDLESKSYEEQLDHWFGMSLEKIILNLDAYEKVINILENRLFNTIPELSNSLADRQYLKGEKYRISVMRKNLKEAQKKKDQRNRNAQLKRLQNPVKAQNPQSAPHQIMKSMAQLMKAQQAQVKASQPKLITPTMKYPTKPDTYEKVLENIEPLRESDPDGYMITRALVDKEWLEGKVGSEATKELINEFMTPEKPELVEDLLADDTPAINPDGSRMTLWEALSYNEKFAKNWQGCMTYEQHLEDVEHKKQTQWMIDNWELHLEQEKQKKLDLDNKKQEWERTQAINRRADQLIADAKAKEQLKCLTQKKSAVPIVEESLDSTA